jgi:hypothetical protein
LLFEGKRIWHYGLLAFRTDATEPEQKHPFPLLQEVQDLTWKPYDLTELLHYLINAKCVLTGSGGKHVCKVCGTVLGWGADWRSDNEFAWPKDLAHYVEFHHVRLPDKFVDRIRVFEYEPPQPLAGAFDAVLEHAGIPTMRKPKPDSL